MTHTELYSHPIARVPHVRARLEIAKPTWTHDHIDWDEVEQAVNDVFGELASWVKRLRPSVRSRAGSNRSPAVILYVYRVFEPISDPESDAIVVGVAFKNTPHGILVRGDICGEDSGTVYFEHPDCRKEVPKPNRAVLTAASAVAARLEREIDRLIEMLDEQSAR